MRTISLRALHRDPPTDETVVVTHAAEIVGTFVPVSVAPPEAMQLARAPIAVAEPAERRARQAKVDEVLRKVSRGK